MKNITPFGFRCLTLLSALISLFSSLVLTNFLPPLPIEHTKLIFPETNTFFTVVICFNFFLGLSTVLGFCMFWRWSRPVAIFSYALTYISYSMCAYFIDAGVKVALDALSILLGGVVLSMAYYSPIAQRFK